MWFIWKYYLSSSVRIASEICTGLSSDTFTWKKERDLLLLSQIVKLWILNDYVQTSKVEEIPKIIYNHLITFGSLTCYWTTFYKHFALITAKDYNMANKMGELSKGMVKGGIAVKNRILPIYWQLTLVNTHPLPDQSLIHT